MSLSTRLDKIEAALRGRDPPDEPRLVYRLPRVCRRLSRRVGGMGIGKHSLWCFFGDCALAFVLWKRSPDRDDNLLIVTGYVDQEHWYGA
jgi:hypothetical protein